MVAFNTLVVGVYCWWMHKVAPDASYEYQWPSPPMRSDDAMRAERSEHTCRICGEMFTVAAYLKQHRSYYINGEYDQRISCLLCGSRVSCADAEYGRGVNNLLARSTHGAYK